MSFNPPTLPIKCNIWQGQAGLVAPPTGPPTQANVPCALRHYKTVGGYLAQNNHVTVSAILLAARTDIRPTRAQGQNGDLVEVPAGSGCFWVVEGVADVARGFANEYRLAWLITNWSMAAFWVWPMP